MTRCERSIICWIWSEITVFAVTCWRHNKYRVFCIRNISKTMQTSGKKHAEHCLAHVNKTACEIWSVFDKVHFWVKTLTPFFHRSLQLWMCYPCSHLPYSKQYKVHCISHVAVNCRGKTNEPFFFWGGGGQIIILVNSTVLCVVFFSVMMTIESVYCVVMHILPCYYFWYDF